MNPLDMFRLDDKVVVLTGASSGLGAGFARALGAVGASLVLAARRVDRLESLAEELRDQGVEVLVQQTDVSVPDDCSALATAAVERFGRIDVLINNAGVGGSMPSSRETAQGFDSTVAVNLTGAFLLSQACVPHMPRGSAIVNVASILGHVAPRFPQAAYVASKSGLLGLTRALAQEWSGRKGIRVNALCPGYFLTEMTELGADDLRDTVEKQSILGRFGEQHELNGALLYLVTPASSYTTGTSIVVDGGVVAM